ncbi:MAG: SPOR domain-containing protein [Alphaproteobacteria bacterium]|nr:SPOR domain-containing protein [Alphaproteobacteria bacterium]
MTKEMWIGIFAMGLVASAAFAGPATAVLIAEVQAALDKGDAGQAAVLAERGLNERGISASERGRLLLYRGLAQELLGVHDAAVGDLSQALATNALPAEEQAQAFLQRGFLRDGQGRLDQAISDYSAVIAMKGEGLATALNNRANIFRRQNRMMEARRDYLAALSAGSSKPQYSYYGLGQIAEAQADTVAARSSYVRAIAADPDYSLASERLAALGGPPDGIIADTDKVILHSPAPVAAPADRVARLRVVTQTSRESDSNIVLRAPHAQVLPRRLPPPHPHPSAERSGQTAPAPLPVRISGGLVLRPALDQQETAPVKSASVAGTVQLGAWRSQAEADAGWNKAKDKAPAVLGLLSPQVVTADLPGRGRFYRLRVSPAAGQTQAGLCDSLMSLGLGCLPVRD